MLNNFEMVRLSGFFIVGFVQTKMKHVCPKCNVTMTSWRNLQKHKNRVIPCDHKCRICGEQFQDTRRFTKHMRKEHLADDSTSDGMEVAVLEPVKQLETTGMSYREARRRYLPERIPLDDYNWEALTQSDEMKASWTKISEGRDGKKMLERVTYERYIIERSENLSEDMHDFTKLRSLEALNQNRDIKDTMAQLLYEVEGQKYLPRFRSITKADDGNLLTYRRVPGRDSENEACEWTSHAPNEVHRVVNEHSRKLLMFALQAGIYLLKMSLWIENDCGTALFTHETHADGTTYVIVVYFDKKIKELRCKRDSRFSVKDFIPIPENDSPALFKQMTRLITLVEQRQQDIINTLESVQLSKSDIDFVFKLQSQS